MKRRRIALLYSNPSLARGIGPALGDASCQILFPTSIEQLRFLAVNQELSCVVADMEAVSFRDLRTLQREHSVQVICVHRNASESLWVEALSAGAIDCCYPDDCSAINHALRASRSVPVSMALAAAA